jgi:SAM-dependent methyltransferase
VANATKGTIVKDLIGNDPAVVAARYDKLAPWMDFLERFLFSPKGFRERALSRLHLPIGGRALIVGCGGGAEIAIVRNFVGAQGHVDAIDVSPKQIEIARALCTKNGWDNVTLHVANAADFVPEAPYDGIVLAFSYIAMSPYHRDITRHLWNFVVAGGHMGAMENKLPARLEFIRPLVQAYVNSTYLGDIRIDPRLDFVEFGRVDNYDEVHGSHCMATVRKP